MAAMKPFRDSSSDLADSRVLSARAGEDGYLFFPGLLPAADIMAIRQAVLPGLDALGWLLKSGPDDSRAIANPDRFQDDSDPDVAALVCRHSTLPQVQKLQHHPTLTDLFERLFGQPVFPLPRILLRYIFPQRTAHTTPQHQDYPHVQGSTRVFTAWIPLGDCTASMGGLKIAAGSHRLGVLPLHPAMGAGGMAVAGDFSTCWRYSEMRAGDVLLFNCLTVHEGAPNLSDRMRLSIDLRYQPLSEPVTEEWLHPHRRHSDWQTLYRDLADDTYKYYWKKLDLKIVPYDLSYYEARDEEALAMAAAGDRRAAATLRRIANRDPDPGKRERALSALRRLEAAADV